MRIIRFLSSVATAVHTLDGGGTRVRSTTHVQASSWTRSSSRRAGGGPGRRKREWEKGALGCRLGKKPGKPVALASIQPALTTWPCPACLPARLPACLPVSVCPPSSLSPLRGAPNGSTPSTVCRIQYLPTYKVQYELATRRAAPSCAHALHGIPVHVSIWCPPRPGHGEDGVIPKIHHARW